LSIGVNNPMLPCTTMTYVAAGAELAIVKLPDSAPPLTLHDSDPASRTFWPLLIAQSVSRTLNPVPVTITEVPSGPAGGLNETDGEADTGADAVDA
jgi:hypothetical protein